MSYTDFQDTGISWAPMIPAHWHTVAGKRVATPFGGKEVPDDARYDGMYPVYGSGGEFKRTNYCLCENEAVVFGRKGTIGKPLFVNEAFWAVDTIYYTICNSKYIQTRYLYYMLQVFDWSPFTTKTAIPSVVANDVFNSKFILPPCDEQKHIVEYLDWKLSIINRLISAAKKEISLIKEIEANQITSVVRGQTSKSKTKSSSIFGIGEVPEHWLIRANKRIFKERNEKSESGTETLLSVSRYYGVKPSNELSEDEQYATIKPAESLVGYKIVKKNDLAMNIMRAQNGSYGISDYEGIVSPAYCVYELLPGYSPKYMHYLLKTPQMISIFFAASSGITDHRRRLYADDFLRIKIAVPPFEEQEQIVEQIEKIEATFQGKTAAIEKQIELLKELRTRLISDVVTGQIDVRDIEIPEYEFVEDVSEDSEDSESEEEIVEQEDM